MLLENKTTTTNARGSEFVLKMKMEYPEEHFDTVKCVLKILYEYKGV